VRILIISVLLFSLVCTWSVTASAGFRQGPELESEIKARPEIKEELQPQTESQYRLRLAPTIKRPVDGELVIDRKLRTRWDYPIAGYSAAYYMVGVKPSPQGQWLQQSGQTNLKRSDMTLNQSLGPVGTQLYVTVKACDSSNQCSESQPRRFVLADPLGTPQLTNPPNNDSYNYSNRKVNFQWSIPSGNPDSYYWCVKSVGGISALGCPSVQNNCTEKLTSNSYQPRVSNLWNKWLSCNTQSQNPGNEVWWSVTACRANPGILESPDECRRAGEQWKVIINNVPP
jgi:hypothetical protein